jgi:outer membrane protein TolC
MKATIPIVAIAIVALAGSAGAQTITMDDYFVMVRERHPFFVKEAMQPDIETLRRDRNLGVKDWVLSSSPYVAYEQPIQTSAFTPEEVTSAGVNARLERTFWGHGGRMSLTWSSDLLDQKLPAITVPGPGGPIDIPIGPSTFYQNRLELTYSLPLLQNRGGILDRLDYDLGEYGIEFADIQALENQENFLLEVADRFVDWAFVSERARIAQALLQLQEEQLDRTKRKRRANLVDEVDVLRGQDAVAVARQEVVSSESRFKAQAAELAVLAKDDGINAMTPDMDLYALETLPDVEVVVENIGRQRIVRALRTRVEQLRTQKRGLDDLSRPQLNLDLTGALQEGDGRFLDAWVYSEPIVQVALGFRFPLENRTAEADVQRVSLEIRQLEKQIESVSLDLEARLRSVMIGVKELEEIMAVNRDQIETARRKTIEEQRLYDQGRNELTFVIQSRNNEAVAELTLATNAAAYRKLILSYRALVDELLPTGAQE